MTHLRIIFLFLFFSQTVFSQQKTAEIRVLNYNPSSQQINSIANAINLTLEVTFLNDLYLENKRDNFVILFFISRSGLPLELLRINEGRHESIYYRIKGPGRYNIALNNKYETNVNSIIFPVLVKSENIYSLEKRLGVVEKEFFDINDVLNILYKSKIYPLTYTEIAR